MGPIGGLVANILAFQASAKATTGVLEWASSASRRVVGYMAKEVARSKLIRNENVRRTTVQFLESDPIGRASRTGKMYAGRVMRSIENHPDRNFRIGARALVHAVKDEALYLPANYMMYRVAKFTAKTPDEKEDTASFRKYYFGAPMVMSVAGGLALNKGIPKTKNFLVNRVKKTISKNMDTARVREFVRRSNNVAAAGSEFLNKFNAHRMAVKSAVSDKGMLFALGRTKGSWSNFAKSYSEEYNKFYRHYKYNAYDHVSSLQSTITRYIADSHAEMNRYLDHANFASENARSKYISDRAAHVKDSIYKMVEAHNNYASKPTAFMKAANSVGIHAEHQFTPIDMKRAILASGKFRYTDADFAALPKVAKRYGSYTVAGKQLNLGSMSFDALSDNIVDTFSKGATGTILGMFGLNEAFKTMSARNALTTITRHVANSDTKLVLGKSFMPKNANEAVYNNTMEEKNQALDVAHQMTGLSGTDAEDFIKSRVPGEHTVTGESKYSMFLHHARHGTLMMNQGDLLIMHPGGHMRMESTVGKGNSRRTLNSDISGATGIKYLGFSSARTRASKIMSSALGSYSTGIHDDSGAKIGTYYYGPTPYEGQEQSIGLFGKIAKAIDVGQGETTSAFSKIMSVFTKHTNPNNTATLFSKLFIENDQWRENTARQVRGSFDLCNVLRKSRNKASTELVMRLKQKLGSKNLVSALSDLDEHLDIPSDLSYTKYLITEGDTLEEAAEKSKGFSDFLYNLREKNAPVSPYDQDISEINHLQSLFPAGRTGYVADVADTTYRGKVKPNTILGIGRGYRVSAVDEYNGKVLAMVGTERRLKGFADPFDEIMRNRQKFAYGSAGETLSSAVTNSEKSAFIAASHTNEMYHKIATELHKVPAGDLDALKGTPGDTIRDHIIHMTGSADPDWKATKQYYVNSDGVAATWHDDSIEDSISRHGDQIFAYPGMTKGNGLFKRVPVDLNRGITATQGVLNIANMSALHIARSFNEVIGQMGLGFSDKSYGTIGEVASNIILKRVLPAGALIAGYNVADEMSKKLLKDTPLGEGITVAGMNALASARLGSQGLLDALHITDATKYIEDLMPGSVTSPASGLARGVGPTVVGLALGRKYGPKGALTGGIVGSAVGALVGGLPLGVFGEWDISKSREELVNEYTGKEQVAVRKGRFWELGCLKDSALVQTRGFTYTQANSLSVGDSVVNRDGSFSEVRTVFKRKFTGDIYKVRAYINLSKPTEVTGNHIVPRLSIYRDEQYYNLKEPEIAEVRIDELQVNDFVEVPIPQLGNKCNSILLTEVSNVPIPNRVSESHITIALDYDFGRLCGYFLAEGNLFARNREDRLAGKYRAIETVHSIHEKEYVDDIVELSTRIFGVPASFRHKKTGALCKEGCYVVRICSTVHADMFYQLFYKNTGDKDIPDFLMHSNPEFRAGLVEGYWRGDGHTGGIRRIISSARYSLIYKTQAILLNAGFIASINSKEENGFKGKYKVSWNPNKTFSDKHEGYRYIDGRLYSKIYDITTESYDGLVYDFEIEHPDHLFVCGSFLVHNSTPFEGTRIEYFRPSMYALTRSDYKHAPGFKDSLITEAIGGIAPDVYAMKNYYSRPYPMTSGLFSNIPVLSNVLNMTGASKLLGGGIAMHNDDISAEKQFNMGRSNGFSTKTLSTMYENNDGVFSNTGRSNGSSGFGPNAISQSSFEYGAGETVNQALDIVGIRGFAASTLSNNLLGQGSFFSDAPVMAAPTDISGIRSYWDMSLGGLLGMSEGIRRIIPHKRGSIDSFNPITNTMPNWLPGNDYYLDFRSGDPYTVVPMGEARLPGPGYLLSHGTNLTMPVASEVMGEQVDSQVAFLLGMPEYMSDRNKREMALKPIVNDFLEQNRAAGDLMHVNKTAYNAKYDVYSTVDAIIRGDKGQDVAVKFVPKGFAGQSDINAFMVMSGTTEGLLMEVDPDGSYATHRVFQDSDQFLSDVRRAKKAGIAAAGQMKTLESQGKAMNYGNALSWLDRLKILSDVAPYSKETQVARGIVKAQRQAGTLSKEEEEQYFTTLDQTREKEDYMNFSEYRFSDMGKHVTAFGKQMDAFYSKEYSTTEQIAGSVWEKFAHIKTPLNSKLLHQSSAMEEYERNYVYGKLMPQWDSPVNDFLGTYANRMMNTTSMSQSALSWATGGLLLGGTPLAMPMAATGAIMGKFNSVFGQSLPDEVEARREVMYQADLVEYAKNRALEQEGNHRSYAVKASNTLTAYGIKGMGPDISKIGQFLGNPESYFMKGIINNMTSDDLEKAQTLLPQPALASLYREMGHAGQSAAVMKDFHNQQIERYMPDDDSSVYSADVSSDAPYITTLAQEGLNLHDSGMGWSSQLKNIANMRANGLYDGDTVYGSAFSGKQLSTVLGNLETENSIRKALASISTSVTMMQDGSDTIEVTLIER